MKRIRYTMCTEVNQGTLEKPDIKQIFSSVSISWSENSEEIAKREAYNGEYEIVDDGQPEPIVEPTQLDKLEAQIAYLAMMSGYDELLEV